MLKPLRFAIAIAGLASVSACDQMSKATPQERVGYLRELVRARTVARDTLPIDGCSVNRFLDDVPAWRDSLARRSSKLGAATRDAPRSRKE